MYGFCKNLSRIIATVILAFYILLLTPGAAYGSPETRKTIRIGVLAKRGLIRCIEKWGPTAEYLTSEIPDHSFTVVPLSFDEVYPAVERKEVDFILANSSFYVGLESLHGVSRIVTLKNLHLGKAYTVFGGVIFWRADRKDIKQLDDLKGKTFMAAEERSFGGWRIGWRELKRRGIDPHRDFSDLSFGGTHDAVVYAVRDGKVDAGTVRTDTLERMAIEGNIRLDDFRVFPHREGGKDPCDFPLLHSTDVYPEWPLAALEHTSDELAEKVAATLLRMSPDSPAAKSGRCAGWTIPHNYQSVHDCLKELRVEPYKDYGRVTLSGVIKQYWPWIVAIIALVISMAVAVLFTSVLNRRLKSAQKVLKEEVAERKAAEEKLRETRDYLENLLNYANTPIIVWDPKFRITRFNHAFERLTGKNADEVAGKQLDILFPDESRDEAMEHIRRATMGERWETVEIPILRTDGTVRNVFWNSATLYAADSTTVTATIAQGVDITERRQSEERLRLFSHAVNSANDGMAMGNLDGRLTYVNDAFIEIFGYSREELIGKEIAFLYPEDQIPKLEKALKATAENGWTGELVARRKDGGTFPIMVSSSRVFDPEGNVIAHMAGHRDITKRKRAEEALRESRERLNLAITGSNAGLWDWILRPGDPRGVLPNEIYLSPQLKRFIGYEDDEFPNSIDAWNNRMLPEDFSRLAENARECFEGRTNRYEAEYRIRHKDNSIRWIHSCGKLQRDENGQPIRWTGVDWDITERKRAEEELRKAHDELEQRVEERTAELRMAGEELRRYDTQLKEMVEERTQELKEANIQLELEITKRRWAEEQQQASLREKEVLLKEIHHRVKNNLQTISSLLDLEAESIQDPQARKMLEDSQNRVRSIALIHEKLYQNENLATIDIAEYIKRLVDHLFDAYGGQAYAVTPNIRVDDVLLNIDTAIPCGLIICELVSNALKYAFPEGDGGEIHIQLRTEDNDRLRLSVSDNGVGLPQDLNFDNPPSLGLQLVSMLIQQLKGTIELDRSAGTLFNITFTERKHQMEQDNGRHTAPRC